MPVIASEKKKKLLSPCITGSFPLILTSTPWNRKPHNKEKLSLLFYFL
jgi:hypothetical protein